MIFGIASREVLLVAGTTSGVFHLTSTIAVPTGYTVNNGTCIINKYYPQVNSASADTAFESVLIYISNAYVSGGFVNLTIQWSSTVAVSGGYIGVYGFGMCIHS